MLLDDGVRLFFGGEIYIAVLTFFEAVRYVITTRLVEPFVNVMLEKSSTSWLLTSPQYSLLAGYRQLVNYFINQEHVLHG